MSFEQLTHQLRFAQCIALMIKCVALFMESEHIGMYFVVPLAVNMYNLYHTGRRHYYNIDGRFDFSQMLTVPDMRLKAQYAFASLGSLLLSVIGYVLLHEVPSTFVGVLYRLSTYVTIGGAAIVLVLECYETIMNKLR